MKLLVTCQPAVGHFHAVAPLARAAEAAGHEVIVATGRGMGPWVEKAGFAAREVGPQWLAEGAKSSAFDDPKRRLRLMSMATGSMIDDLVILMREVRPDVVLHESLEWAAPLAADAVGLPYAALGQLPTLPRPMMAKVLGGPWNSARAGLHLGPDPNLERLYPYLYLDAYLPSMQPLSASPLEWLDPHPLPNVSHLVQPPLYQVMKSVPRWLDDLPDLPTIYVTMGTAFNRVAHIFTAIAQALREEELNVVMTVGSGVDPGPLNDIGDNIWAEEYIAQDVILSRCDAVVFHAGFLTMVGALHHGLPMVAIPVAVDQPYHAHRLAAAGAARQLDANSLEPQGIRAAVRAVVDDPLYRCNAGRLQDEMRAMPPMSHGIDLLERLAETRQPILAGDGAADRLRRGEPGAAAPGLSSND